MDGIKYGLEDPISAEGIQQDVNEWRATQTKNATTTKRASSKPQRLATIPFFNVSEDKDNNCKIQLSPHDLLAFLSENKFFRFSTSKGERVFVRATDNVIEPIEVDHITDFIYKFCEKGKEPHGLSFPEMFDTLTRNRQYICESFYARLTPENSFNFVKDTATACYLFFQNGFLEITKNGWELKPYTELKGYIWKEQIIPYNFNSELIADRKTLPAQSDFTLFLLLISEGYLNEKRELLETPNLEWREC